MESKIGVKVNSECCAASAMKTGSRVWARPKIFLRVCFASYKLYPKVHHSTNFKVRKGQAKRNTGISHIINSCILGNAVLAKNVSVNSEMFFESLDVT